MYDRLTVWVTVAQARPASLKSVQISSAPSVGKLLAPLSLRVEEEGGEDCLTVAGDGREGAELWNEKGPEQPVKVC